MTHATATASPTPTDHFAEAIAEAVARRVQQIQQTSTTAAAIAPADLDMLYPVTLICQQLGKRGRPIAYQTFQKRYLDTKLLRLIDNPHDHRSRYVRLGDWLKLKQETKP